MNEYERLLNDNADVREFLNSTAALIQKHGNADSVKKFIELNGRFKRLEEEFEGFLDKSINKIDELFHDDIELLENGIKEHGTFDGDVYEKILAKKVKIDEQFMAEHPEEYKAELIKEQEFLQRYSEVLQSVPKVKKSLLKYIKDKNLNDKFKDFVLYIFRETKETCEMNIAVLTIKVAKAKSI